MIVRTALMTATLLPPKLVENDVEFVLLGCSFTGVTTGSRTCSNSNRCSSRYAPLVFEHLYELYDFHDRLRAQFFEQIFV